MPGMYAETTLTLEARDNVLGGAFGGGEPRGRPDQRRCRESAGKVERRAVTMGLETSTDAEIVSGLAEGESVIVSDRSGLKAGEEVRPQAVQMLQYHGAGQ